jgi:hypothetical protein
MYTVSEGIPQMPPLFIFSIIRIKKNMMFNFGKKKMSKI